MANLHEDRDRIAKVVDLAAPVARVWRALADHDEFGAWFGVRLDGPFRVGESTVGRLTQPGLEHVEWVSVTERMDHERLFVFSWPPSALDPETVYGADAKVLVEFLLEPTDSGGTRLTITETGFLQFPDSCRADALRSCREGWDMQAKNIAAHVGG